MLATMVEVPPKGGDQCVEANGYQTSISSSKPDLGSLRLDFNDRKKIQHRHWSPSAGSAFAIRAGL
jgi:hypothetical protein